MGIPGLTRFLTNYSQHVSHLEIRDCTVIIDGYCLAFEIFNIIRRKERNVKRSQAHLVGGDYLEFGQRMRQFFRDLQKCQITAIVILDGAYEDNKLDTVYHRFQDIIKSTVVDQNQGKPRVSRTPPVGMLSVFFEVLREERVLHFRTLFEADDTVAMVAAKFNAPIISLDSDFQVYRELTGFTIPPSHIEFKDVTKQGAEETQYALVADVVNLKLLCLKQFDFKPDHLELLPILGILLGNDKIPRHFFQNFQRSANSDERIERILKWLQKRTSYDLITLQNELQKEFLSVTFVDNIEGKTENVSEMIQDVLNGYLGLNGENEIWKLVQSSGINLKKAYMSFDTNKVNFNTTFTPSDVNLVLSSMESKSDVKKKGNLHAKILISRLPNWFIDLHCQCEQSSEALELFLNKRIGLIPQVELSEFIPAQTIAIPIIQVTAGLVLGDQIFKVVSRSISDATSTNRVTSLQELVKTTTFLPSFGELPTIFDTTCRSKGRSIVLEVFGCISSNHQAFINKWPQSHRFEIMTLIYFLELRPDCFPIAIGIILSILKSGFEQTGDDFTIVVPSNKNVSSLINAQKMTKLLSNIYDKFGTKSINTKHYDISNVYHYSEYKCILTHGRDLNTLLGTPFDVPKFKHFDSYLVYNVFENVKVKFQNHSRAFISHWFQDEPIAIVFELFLDFVENMNLTGTEKSSNPIPTPGARQRHYHQISQDEFDSFDDQFDAMDLDGVDEFYYFWDKFDRQRNSF